MLASVRDIVGSYDAKAPLAEASTPPSSWYTDERIFELEMRSVFSRSWQVAGRAEQVREPGQYITCHIAGEPILVVRGRDGVLRGFFNVCRHHAAAVVTEAAGKTPQLRCPYHGWTYDLSGSLVHTPEFAGVADFDRSSNGLLPVQIEQWQGWVFVRLAANGSSIESFPGNVLSERFDSLKLNQFHWVERRAYAIHCNWKVFVDNYLDGGYHVPHIHQELASVLHHAAYKIETGERHCLQWSPLAPSDTDPHTAAVRAGAHASYFWIYPNFMINLYEGVMDTNLVLPLAVDRCQVIFDFYFTDVSESARERHRSSIAVSERVQAEDIAICESVQRGLTSRAYNTGRLSVRREAGEHLFHRLLYDDLSSAS